MTEAKTYRMKFRVVRGAPNFDTVEHPDRVEVRATNAWDAERIGAKIVCANYANAKEAYAVTKRRVRDAS